MMETPEEAVDRANQEIIEQMKAVEYHRKREALPNFEEVPPAPNEKQGLRQFIRDEFRKLHDRLNKIEREIG